MVTILSQIPHELEVCYRYKSEGLAGKGRARSMLWWDGGVDWLFMHTCLGEKTANWLFTIKFSPNGICTIVKVHFTAVQYAYSRFIHLCHSVRVCAGDFAAHSTRLFVSWHLSHGPLLDKQLFQCTCMNCLFKTHPISLIMNHNFCDY